MTLQEVYVCESHWFLILMHFNTNVIFLKLLCILNEISLELKNIIVNHQQFLYKKIKPQNNKIHSLKYHLQITGISKQTLYYIYVHVLKTKQIFQGMYLLWVIYLSEWFFFKSCFRIKESCCCQVGLPFPCGNLIKIL